MELSAYLAVSLDGFIARADESMDWLRGGGPRPADEAQRYRTVLRSIDASNSPARRDGAAPRAR